MRVVLVRPWTDAHGGTGCCSGDARDGVCFDGRVDGAREHDHEVSLLAETFRRLREQLPDVDVQVVAANNTAFLLPSTFRAVRRSRGLLGALREANRATTAGSLLVDGVRVGDLSRLGPEGAVEEVRRRHREAQPGGV